MAASIPEALRFPPPPEAWTRASDEVLAAFVEQVVTWRDSLANAFDDGGALATVLTEHGRVNFAAALRRERPPPDVRENASAINLFPELDAAIRIVFDHLMKWRDCSVNQLELGQDLPQAYYHRRDALLMCTCLHPAGPEPRCDVCVLRMTEGHRCPMR